jgi:glycosyltransferase involved in cell wall biosynthesis
MNTPLVSVVIPNYNHAVYLPQRIDTVLNQTFQDIEVILLDDCSTDYSREIIEAYARDYPRIRTCFNQQNSGSPFAQWNKGVDMAQGKYIWIAESDDYASPQFLDTLVAPLNTHPNVGLAYCQSHIVNEAGQITGTAEAWTDDLDSHRWKKAFINQGSRECWYLLYKNTILNASAVLFRKATFLEVGGGDPSMKMVGDWLVWMKMLLIADIYFSPVPLNYFRTHSGTTRQVAETEKILQRADEAYKVLGYGLNHVVLSEEEKESILQSVFTRIANSLPLRLIFSSHVKKFINTAQTVDPAVKRRIRVYLPILYKRFRSYFLILKRKSTP